MQPYTYVFKYSYSSFSKSCMNVLVVSEAIKFFNGQLKCVRKTFHDASMKESAFKTYELRRLKNSISDLKVGVSHFYIVLSEIIR